MLEIREMKLEDLDIVAEMETQIFSQPWSKSGFQESIEKENTIYLTAIKDGEIAGYCGLMQVLEEGDITNVAVSKHFRNQKIGCQMLKKLMEEGKNRGILSFTLEVRESNQSAIHLYEKLGFVVSGIRKNFYEKPIEHAVIMWKH